MNHNSNHIKDTIDISSGSGEVVEPVTLEGMKDYLRVAGFVDDSDSTSIPEFDDDDELIKEFITTARQHAEEKLNVSIINHEWSAIGVNNQCGNQQLNYGPVRSIISVKDSDEKEYDISRIKVIGDFLVCPNDCNMTVDYEAGFTKVPEPIITEIKRMVAYLYINRGDVDGLEGYKYSISLKYSRRSWLV